MSASRFGVVTQRALEQLEYELLTLAWRQGHIINVRAELDRVTRSKRFLILHNPIWTTTLDARDMLVVDLASWIKAFYSKGGFLKKLQGPDLKALDHRWKGESSDARLAAYSRLFPAAVNEWPSWQDVEALIAIVHARFRPLFDDRGDNRAHKFEAAKKEATAAMLDPDEVTRDLLACEEILADLRLLSSNSQFDSHRYQPEVERGDWYAEDVVDLVLRGTIRGIVAADRSLGDPAPHYWQRREAHYDALHAEHARRSDAGSFFFNAPTREEN